MQPPNNERVYSVTQICQDIKLILEAAFAAVWVEGEVSNFQAAASGHAYFTLKDDAAVIPAAIFARAYSGVRFKVENGQKVVCYGKVSAYGPRGNYQIIVEKIEPKGMGAMQLALEQLKKKLEKEGLFAPEHKREVPYLPSKIGIVTSLQGAAIKDILKVLERRFKGSELILAHAQVQGESAGREIVQGIEDLNTLNQKLPAKEKIEVLIVGRGGGSIEDLWAFNEEKVARAIYNSRIPVISAVGHERDWTIADLVADMRAPTPSAAAEIVLPEIAELKERVSEVYEDLKRGFESKLQDCFQAADDLRHKLKLLSPTLILEQHARKITELSRSINTALEHFFKLRQLELARAAGNLSNLNPLNILSRGYSATFAQDGTVLRSAAQARPGGRITTRFADGELKSTVTEVIHGRA